MAAFVYLFGIQCSRSPAYHIVVTYTLKIDEELAVLLV